MTPAQKTPEMISAEYSQILCLLPVAVGSIAFTIGIGIGMLRELPFEDSFLRGSLLCVAASLPVRIILMRLIRLHAENLCTMHESQLELDFHPEGRTRS